jgi:hypothetical protein
MTRKLRREAEVDTLLAKVIKRTAERVRCPPQYQKPVESVFSRYRRRMGLSQAAGDEKPAERVSAGEGCLAILRADSEAHGLEGFDFQAIGKGMAQLGLRDASRSFRSRGGVAETKQEQTPAGIEDGLEPAHVANAVRVGKNVK